MATGFYVLGPGGLVQPVDPTPVLPAAVRELVVRSLVVESAGGRVNLLQAPYMLEPGFDGLHGFDSTLSMADLAGLDGAYVEGRDEPRRGLVYGADEVYLVVRVNAGGPIATQLAVQDLWDVLSVRRHGPATLSVVRFDGSTRDVTVWHEPKKGDRTPGLMHEAGQTVRLRLQVPVPFWRGSERLLGPWQVGGAGGGELPIELPADLAGSTVVGQANNVEVLGDDLAWPTEVFTGPWSDITGERADGRSWHITEPGLAGDVLYVRHDPLTQLGGLQVELVRSGSSTDWDEFLEPGSDLFELWPGVDSLTYTVAGGVAGQTSAKAVYRPTYLAGV